ncbi:MAG TPA: ferredoxin [Acidimicrobiales bacterium]
MTKRRLMLVVDPIACAGHGICAELLPEQIATDPWGYPLVSPDEIPTGRLDRARRAVDRCPRQAIHLVERAR